MSRSVFASVSQTAEKIVELGRKGYEVIIRKSPEHDWYPDVFRIELRKEDNHHVQLIDISDVSLRVRNMSADQIISRALWRAELEFNRAFEKEE